MPDQIVDESDFDWELSERVRGEYREMPGLQLTLAQASRLWNTDLIVSRHVLDALVDTAFLRRSGAHYVRADADQYFV